MVTKLKQHRFQPRPLATVVAVIFTTAFLLLGLWQVSRVNEKNALAADFAAKRALPVLDLASRAVDIEQDRYREAEVRGAFEQNQQVFIENVVREGRPGFAVYAAFRPDAGDVLLVDRGWIAQPADRHQTPQAPLPSGLVTLSGWLDYPRSLPVIVPGEIPLERDRWPYLDMVAMARRVGEPLPGYVLRARPGNTRVLSQSAPQFDPKTGMHIGYAIQWFAFAAFAAGAYLAVSLKKTA